MMFGIFEDNGEPMRNRTFDDATRNCIKNKFLNAWQSANSHIDPEKRNTLASQAADEFIVGLETYADPDYLMLDKNIPTEHSKKRRIEKLIAVANALESLRAAIDKVMPFDLMNAIYPGLLELQKRGLDMPGGPWKQAVALTIRSISRRGEDNPSDLKIILDAMCDQLKTRKLRDPYDMQSMKLEIAKEIVNYLHNHNIIATTSSTGLAGMAFEATFELAGLPSPKAGYWITKAKNIHAPKTTDTKRLIAVRTV